MDSMHTNGYIQVIRYILAFTLYPQQQLLLRIYINHSVRHLAWRQSVLLLSQCPSGADVLHHREVINSVLFYQGTLPHLVKVISSKSPGILPPLLPANQLVNS